uniref:Uncharacterized protein n=1 Tax=Rhizophora mucronata TaxID=61149 RepID=A0A2P2IQX0_RHIMU
MSSVIIKLIAGTNVNA